MIDKDTVARIKDRAEIVDVVGDYVHLTRRGANYMGLCPFHNEKTPSFSVNPRRNFCYCFSCHKGGSPVNFIMEKEGVSYHDALLKLAEKYGIKVEEKELSPEERLRATEREGLMIAAQRAMKIMENDLSASEEGRNVGLSYLYSRGVTEEAIRVFRLGYALDEWQHITDKMTAEGFDVDTLKALGLTGQSQNGRLFDKYKGRVIFPILNSGGKPVGFGGRDLKGGPAKYINSPESVLYKKNQELYGIFQAKSEIKKQNRCYLVEGYLDVISMWQSGIQNVVASSGTALTDGQIALLHRFTDNITLLYDGDKAGIKAALRGIDMLLSHKLQVSVLLLPDGDDPDSFAKKHTPEEFRAYIRQNETDIIKFKMQILLNEMGDSPQERARVINDISASIACIPNDIQRLTYIGECSRLFGIEEATVARTVDLARMKILENIRRERSRKEIDRDYPNDNNVANTLDYEAGSSDDNLKHDSSNQQNDRLIRDLTEKQQKKEFPLRPLEKGIIRMLVRYGYMAVDIDGITSGSEETPSADGGGGDNMDVLYTVTDLVNDEMESNGLRFSYPPYERLFHLLLDHLDEYVGILDERKISFEQRLLEERKAGLRDIASKVTTIQEIEKEEKKLQLSLEERKQEMIEEFARFYPGEYLISHEDEEIRGIATELFSEQYELSKLFQKNTSEITEKDLSKMVNRGLNEWKSELLTLHLEEIKEELKAIGDSDPERELSLLQRLKEVMHQRSRLAKDCGERIVAKR